MDPEVQERPFAVEVDSLKIKGFAYIPSSRPCPLLVILHGIPRAKPAAGDSSYRDLALEFSRAGFLSVIFNFRGTGLSGGDLSMAGWTRDLAAVLDHVRRFPEAEGGRLALVGFSAGGAIALFHAARDSGVAAVAVAGVPARFSALEKAMPREKWVDLFREIGLIRSPGFPRSVEEWAKEFEEVEPLRWVSMLSPRPLLVLHGEEDELIPLREASRLFERAGEPKEFRVIPGGKHRLRVDPRAVSALREWLLEWKRGGLADEKKNAGS